MKAIRGLLVLVAATTLVAGLAACAGGGAMVGEPGWHVLGRATVNGRVDRDDIAVGAGAGDLTRVRFEVKGSALEMYDIVIHFANGESFSPPTRLTFGRGGDSRVIDLPGGARNIRRITLRYGNLPRGGKARVVVYGK